MLELLTCVQEIGTPDGCCTEAPYSTLQPDCVELCLIRAMSTYRGKLLDRYYAAEMFGEKDNISAMLVQMQDLDLLRRMVVIAFKDWMAQTLAANMAQSGKLSQADIWEQYDMGCWVEHFRCRYGQDIRPWLLEAGFYDPIAVPVTSTDLPTPYPLPCGETIPHPPPTLISWPPDCNLDEPDFWVSFAGDASLMEYLQTIATPDIAIIFLVTSDVQNLNLVTAPVDQITVWGGTSWNTSGLLPPGTTFQAVGGGYYVVDGAQHVVPWFPSVVAYDDGNPCTLSIASSHPTLSITGTRGARVEVSSDGVNWVTIYNGPEVSLSSAMIVDTDCGTYQFTRVTYYEGNCIWPPVLGPVIGSDTLTNTQYFELRADTVSSPMALSMYPEITPVNFLDGENWTFSFWYKGESLALESEGDAKSAIVFSMLNTPGVDPNEAYFRISIDNNWYTGASLNISAGKSGSFGQLLGFLGPLGEDPGFTFDPLEWNHFTLVRTGPLVLGTGVVQSLGTVFKVYVNGQLMPLATVWSVGSGSIINDWTGYPTNQPQQGLVVGTSTIYANGDDTNYGIHVASLDEVYLCKSSRTDTEVANILFRNKMQEADATWQRVLWWRADGDTLGTNGVNSNVGTTPNATIQGNIVIGSGAPPPIMS